MIPHHRLQVVFLALRDNQLSGTIPYMPNLQLLQLSSNRFTEPRFEAVPPTLQFLYLANNSLTGGLQQLGSLKTGYMDLKLLDVSHNKLSGPLPQDLPPSLSLLNMSHNAFAGTLPSKWSKLPMADLRLDKNELTGTLPPSWSTWGSNTGNSIRLSIRDTRLHGNMPIEWVQQFCLAIFKYSDAWVLFKPIDIGSVQSPYPLQFDFGPLIQVPAQQASINVTLASKNYTFDYDNPNSVCGIPEAIRVTALLWGTFTAGLLITLGGVVVWQRRKPKPAGALLSQWKISTVIMHDRVSLVKQVANRVWFLISDIGWTIYSQVTDAITIHQVFSSGQLRYAYILLSILSIPFAVMFILVARVSIKVCQAKVGSRTLIRQAAAPLIGLWIAPIVFVAIELALVFHGLGVPLPAWWGSLDIDLVTFYRVQSIAEAFLSALPQSIVQSKLYLMGNDPNGVHVYINTNLFLVSVIGSLFSIFKTVALVAVELHQYGCSLIGYPTQYYLFWATLRGYCMKLVKLESFPSR